VKTTVLALAIGLGTIAPASAHPLAPALLEITQLSPSSIQVRWKTSLWKQAGTERAPRLPAACVPASEPEVSIDATSITQTWTADCASPTLIGESFGVEANGPVVSETLLRLHLADGRSLQAILRGSDDRFVVPARQPRALVVRDYVALGVEHILTGADHLLFVFGLVLLVAPGRQLVWTVSAFTIGHSVTLSLAVLGYTAFPTALIEVLIAASILALAVELAGGPARASLMRRRPWLMAFVFGLLHGLGFAGALRDAGLPAGEIPAALLSFNLGIEAGQLSFILLVVLAGRLARPFLNIPLQQAMGVPVYLMGAIAAFWLFERASVLLS
jgi:hypothetical protein